MLHAPSLKRESNPTNTMKKVFFLCALLSILSVSAQQAEEGKNFLRGDKRRIPAVVAPASWPLVIIAAAGGKAGFLKGNLGKINGQGRTSDQVIHGEAKRVLENLLTSELRAIGNEKVVPAGNMLKDKKGGVTLKLTEQSMRQTATLSLALESPPSLILMLIPPSRLR
jgi:hypothetical protein